MPVAAISTRRSSWRSSKPRLRWPKLLPSQCREGRWKSNGDGVMTTRPRARAWSAPLIGTLVLGGCGHRDVENSKIDRSVSGQEAESLALNSQLQTAVEAKIAAALRRARYMEQDCAHGSYAGWGGFPVQ